MARVTTRAGRVLPQLLRERRDFRRFWTGQTISLFGDQVTLLALPLVGVLVLHASPAQMGYLAAAGLAPNLLLSLHAGAWVDRHGRRRRIMIAADLGRAGLLATVPLAYALGVLTLDQLYAVAFLAGALSVLFFVSRETLFVSVAPRDRFVEANSLLYGSRAFSFVGGPSLGGLLVQLLSAPVALLADAGSFVASALFLGRIRAAEPPAETNPRGNLRAGARWLRHSPVVRASLASGATINFFLYATRSLHVPPGTLGAVLGAGAVGSVLGSLVTGRLIRRLGIGPAFCLGSLLFGAELGAGFGVMVLDISIGSIFAAVIPDRLRARVMGAYMAVNYSVRPLGSLAGGALGSTVGLRPTLWIAASGGLAGVLWLLPSPVPRLETLPDTME